MDRGMNLEVNGNGYEITNEIIKTKGTTKVRYIPSFIRAFDISCVNNGFFGLVTTYQRKPFINAVKHIFKV